MVYPDQVNNPNFDGFGVETKFDINAKELIYTCNSKFEESD